MPASFMPLSEASPFGHTDGWRIRRHAVSTRLKPLRSFGICKGWDMDPLADVKKTFRTGEHLGTASCGPAGAKDEGG